MNSRRRTPSYHVDQVKWPSQWLLSVRGGTFLLAVATSVLAGATVILAWFTYWVADETAKLAALDRGPNIAIADIGLEGIDETGTARKRWSWRAGEMLGEGSVDVVSIILVMKFMNSGKDHGYVRLRNSSELRQKLGSAVGDSSQLKHFVPPNGEGGWLYPLEILPILGTTEYFDLPLQIEVFGADRSLLKTSEMLIACTDKVGNAKCWPVLK